MDASEYTTMITDIDDYAVPSQPVDYADTETSSYKDLFAQEHQTSYDTQTFHKSGVVLSKAYTRPEQCRNTFHNSFRRTSNYTMRIHENSMLALRVCKKLIDTNKIPLEEIHDYMSKIVVPKDYCPYAQTYKCNRYSKYRTYDGSCNNLVHPWLGKTDTPLKRLYRSRYTDLMSEPVYKSVVPGRLLRNPREIAYNVHYPNDIDINLNTLFVFWGQFVDHDLSLTELIRGADGKPKPCTCDTDDDECLNIKIPSNDPVYTNEKCMVTPRSSASFPRYDCKLGSREQVNTLSHWLDLSQVYGTNKEDNAKVRAGKDGLLKVSSIPGIKYEHLPLAETNSGTCTSEKTGSPCFMGTEIRMNQNLGLLAIHTVLLREHNRIARRLKRINSHWDDERLFQEVRRILIGIYQHIIYKDWIEIIVGKEIADLYDCKSSKGKDYFYGYDQTVNAHISNEFATAAFRFGHTLVTSWVTKSDQSLNLMANITLVDHFLNTREAFKDYGLDGVLRGTIRQKATANDGHLTDVLNNHMFKNPDKDAETHEFSLSALNINRGRDHAIPSYTTYRKICGLSVPTTFEEMDYTYSESTSGMKLVYDHVDDIDLFTGGISEKPVKGGLVGPVFAHIIAKQWRDLRYGDRHYYENGHDQYTRYSSKELAEIRKASINRIICDNIDIDYIPRNPWLVDSKSNPLVNCNSLPYVNLNVWKETVYEK